MDGSDLMIGSFLKYIQFERRYSPHTVESYRSDLRQFQVFLTSFDPISFTEITYRHVRAWIISLVEDGISPTSVNRKMASLRSFYRFLLQREEIDQDPTQRLQALKTPRRLPDFVQENELIRLFDQHEFPEGFVGLRDRVVLELLYGTGIRRAELIGMKDSSVNLDKRQIKVLGKRNKERIIPLSQVLASLLETYLKEKKKFFAHRGDNSLILTNAGNTCYPVFVYRIVVKYLGAASTMKKSPHILRHTFATHLLNHGADLNAVKDLLGHSSLAATQVYTHNSLEKLKEVFEKAHPKA